MPETDRQVAVRGHLANPFTTYIMSSSTPLKQFSLSPAGLKRVLRNAAVPEKRAGLLAPACHETGFNHSILVDPLPLWFQGPLAF